MHPISRLVPIIAMAAAGGWAANRLGLPLAWLVGATLTTAAISLTVTPVAVPRGLYRAGQVVVGVAVGLSVSSDIMGRLGPHVILLPTVALVSIAIGRALMPILARYGRMDRTTAYFALVPAGIAEMADQSSKRGADAGAVATFHTLRVFLIVLIMPFVILQIEAPAAAAAAGSPGGWDVLTAGWTPSLAVALAAGVVAAVLGSRLGLPSAYIVGPMVALSILSGSGLLDAEEPDVMLAVAQVLLGLSLGSRFRRETMFRLPRALAIGIPVMLFHAGLMAALALALAGYMGFRPAVMLLGLATGGTAEMVLTAQAVAADAALVTAYQVARGLLGNLLAGVIHARTVAGGTA